MPGFPGVKPTMEESVSVCLPEHEDIGISSRQGGQEDTSYILQCTGTPAGPRAGLRGAWSFCSVSVWQSSGASHLCSMVLPRVHRAAPGDRLHCGCILCVTHVDLAGFGEITPIPKKLLHRGAPFPESFPAISLQQHHLLSSLNDILAILLPWK